MIPVVFGKLRDSGYFFDPIKRDIELNFMADLIKKVQGKVTRLRFFSLSGYHNWIEFQFGTVRDRPKKIGLEFDWTCIDSKSNCDSLVFLITLSFHFSATNPNSLDSSPTSSSATWSPQGWTSTNDSSNYSIFISSKSIF